MRVNALNCSLSVSVSQGLQVDNKKTHVRTDWSCCCRHTHGLVSWDCEAYYQGNSSVLQGHLRGFFICPFVQLHKLLFPQHTHSHNILCVHVLSGTLKRSVEAEFIIYLFLAGKKIICTHSGSISFSSKLLNKGESWMDTMSTKASQTPAEAAVVDRCSTAPSGSGKPTRELRNANANQELQRYYDQLWNSNQRSSPPLIFYRKLPCDGEKGFISNEACVGRSSGGCEKPYPELPTGPDGSANVVPLISSEGRPCQLDSPGEGSQADRNRTGSSRCSSAMSTPHIDCCLSHTSSHLSPVHSFGSSPTQQKRRHGRRSSLPVSMMAFHKVIYMQLH